MDKLSPSTRRRLVMLALLLGIGFVWLEYRLFDLQILRHEELADKADRYVRVLRNIEPWRGEIRSRDGAAFAMDIPVKEVWADLNVCSNYSESVASVLAPVLKTDPAQLALQLRPDLIGFESDGRPLYRQASLLKRPLTPGEWARIQSVMTNANFGFNPDSKIRLERRRLDRLRRKAVFARDRRQRYYPYGTGLASVLGFVGASREETRLRGRAGMERSLERVLAGESGMYRSEKSAGGIELPWRRRHYRGSGDGNHVVLTIHSPLQRIVEEALAQMVGRHTPSNASILVVQPRTGEILAFASYPPFDPQRPGESPPDTWRNRAISDMVEPGSTFKLVTLAAALNERLVTLQDRIFCEQGAFIYRAPILGRVGYRKIRLRDYKAFAWLTVEEVLAKSSNIGVAKLALRLGPARLDHYIRQFGFGRGTGIPLPNEMPGWVSSHTNWLGGAIVYIPMGQGIAVTQLQMTMAYAAIANDGLLMRPMLVARVESPLGGVLAQYHPQPVRYVVHPKTARLLRRALKTAVTRQGTGSAADSALFTVAGKTGTAQKSNQHGYLPGRYYASFIGLLPADAPELCISIAVDEPHNGYHGGRAAAPAFKQIADAAGALLQIPPDKTRVAGWDQSGLRVGGERPNLAGIQLTRR